MENTFTDFEYKEMSNNLGAIINVMLLLNLT